MNNQLPIDTLGKTIKAHIDSGDKTASRAEEQYMAAGLLLLEAKERVTHTRGMTWTKFLSEQCGIGRSRAHQLISIADGSTSTEVIRAANRESNAKLRQKAKTSITDGQSPEISQQDQRGWELDGARVDTATKEAINGFAIEYRKHTQAHTTHLALAAKDIQRAGTALIELKALVDPVLDWWAFYKSHFDKPQKYAEQAMRDATS